MDTAKIAWLAGLLEGEGCFYSSKSNRNSPMIKLSMTDEDVVNLASDLLDVPYRKLKKIPNRKQVFACVVSGRKARGWMMTLYSFMGKRRRGKIKDFLTYWFNSPTNRGTSEFCKRGHERTPEDSYHFKGKSQCKPCRLMVNREYAKNKRVQARA